MKDSKIIKKPKVSKKVLISEIEQLDVKKQFNLVSLARTNLANILAIRDLLLRAQVQKIHRVTGGGYPVDKSELACG